MRHFLSIDDLNKTDLEDIFYYTKCRNRLNRILATVFFEPSTRTKLSFQAAMYELGGQIINLDDNSSIKKGESNADTIKVISQFADIMVLRGDIKLAKHSRVPVINAGDVIEHPTQALIDLYTINQYVYKKEITIMFTGDLYHSRTINSLLKILKLSNYEINLICTNKINHNFNEHNYITCEESEIPDYIDKVDILYMTRLQVERHTSSYCSGFVLGMDLVNRMKEDAIIMHPLPRNGEILPEVDDNYRSVYFTQAKNGVIVRQALIYKMFYS